MSEFEYNTGYFYPLSEEEYQILNDVDFFGNDIVQPPFYLEFFGHNKYLVLSQTRSYGIENHEFGNSRPLTDNESNLVPMKFSNEFTKIKFNASKFKFVEYCYSNSVDCKDYYLESKPKQSEPMTLNEAIQHCKDVAASKCDECGKEHQQLAEWLQELVNLRIKIKRLGTELRAKHLKAIHTANELAAYEDKTPISDEFLIKNGFTKRTDSIITIVMMISK